jgi:LETM1 and EF-hand domain-containing protein 1
MSLWLPRPSPALLARSHRNLHPAASSHLISSLVLRSVVPQSSGALLRSRRFQSSKPTPAPASSSVPSDPNTASDVKPSPPAPKEQPKGPLLTRAWKKVKHEAAHYWHGSKLLVSEVRISARLQWKILHGDALTRRERRQARNFQPHPTEG